jgi:hypothetical protein
MTNRPRSAAADPMTLGNMRANGVPLCWNAQHDRQADRSHTERQPGRHCTFDLSL